jgi:hypothetical protein
MKFLEAPEIEMNQKTFFLASSGAFILFYPFSYWPLWYQAAACLVKDLFRSHNKFL